MSKCVKVHKNLMQFGSDAAYIVSHIFNSHEYQKASNQKYIGKYRISYGRIAEELFCSRRKIDDLMSRICDKEGLLKQINIGGEKRCYAYTPTKKCHDIINAKSASCKKSINAKSASSLMQNLHHQDEVINAKSAQPILIKDNINNNITKNVCDSSSKEGYPFEAFFSLYGKPSGEKLARQQWEKLSDDDKSAIMAHVSDYVKSTPTVKYRKDMKNYLGEETFREPVEKSYPFNLEPYVIGDDANDDRLKGKRFFVDEKALKVFNEDGTPSKVWEWDLDVGIQEQ